MLTAIGIFIWNTVSQTRQNRAAGIKTNYFRKYLIVLILTSIYLYIIDCKDSLWGLNLHFYLPWYDLIPGIIRQMVRDGHFYLPLPGIVAYFLSDSWDLFLWTGFLAYQLSRLCFIAIWFDYLYSHWRNLSNGKQKTLYVIFSWFFTVVGTQLFGIVMILCYLVYIAFWVIVWIFISMTTGRPATRRKEYELEDGTKLKEEKSLFGEKSYRGSDGAFYKTSDSGKTFTKDWVTVFYFFRLIGYGNVEHGSLVIYTFSWIICDVLKISKESLSLQVV